MEDAVGVSFFFVKKEKYGWKWIYPMCCLLNIRLEMKM